MEPETFAFLSVLVINFVDQVGISFSLPVMVPYGRFIGASLDQIAVFSTVRGIGGVFAMYWMPKLSDKRGRKIVLLLALFGRSLGYFIQGCSCWVPSVAIYIFLSGRGLAGLFSGSIPVINAYITEISGQNKELLRSRLVKSQVASQVAGIALQPISGSLATFSLQLPFFICSAVGLLGLIWTGCVFREASEVRALSGESSPAKAEEVSAPQEVPQQTSAEPSPLLDKVILLCFVGFLAISITTTCIPFLTPIMLEQESFGLQRDTQEATQGEIAMAQSLVATPKGFCSIFCTFFLYLPVTNRFGGGPVLAFAGVLSSLNYAGIGFWIKRLWQLALSFSFNGICIGFLLPAVGPLIARYSSVRYPKNMAFCQAVPMFGAQISSTIGQNIIVFVNNVAGFRYCWVVCGACSFTFTVMLSIAYVLVERRSPSADDLTSEQRKMLLRDGGENAMHPVQDVDAFIESMCMHVRETLTARRGELWNGTAQFLYQQSLQRAMESKFREWRDETQGQEYLEDMHSLLSLSHPMELDDFCTKFPHIMQSINANSMAAATSFISEISEVSSPWRPSSFPKRRGPRSPRLGQQAELSQSTLSLLRQRSA